MSKVEIDGRVVQSGRDPPGQRSFYIPPGDSFREVYRITTFARFPDCVPVNPCALAEHGFVYTGYKDRVKCFRCGRTVENWMVGDDVTSSRWHSTDCELVNGMDADNVPIRRNGVEWTRERGGNPQSRTGPEAGLFRQTDEVSTPAVFGEEMTQETPETPPEQQEGNDDATSLFPCLEPINPHMRDPGARLGTFQDNIRNWPSHRINSTPELMVESGLYYLGERDRVKCWYCNGGLQNWDRYDDPWFEHAKWFPSCEYLLQKKGPAYVHNVVAQYPDINRPTPVNASRSLNLPQVQSSGSSSQARLNMPTIVDPRENVRKLEEKADEEMRRSPYVQDAKVMGFSEREIRFALLRRYEECDSPYPDFASLVEYIIANQHKIPNLQVHAQSPSAQTSSSSQSAFDKLQRLRHERNCKVCNDVPASVVLLPCGHLSACNYCSKDLRHCPLCQVAVCETLNSYIV